MFFAVETPSLIKVRYTFDSYLLSPISKRGCSIFLVVGIEFWLTREYNLVIIQKNKNSCFYFLFGIKDLLSSYTFLLLLKLDWKKSPKNFEKEGDETHIPKSRP